MTHQDDFTERERQPCPTCGIWRGWLNVCHPTNLKAINRCPDSFHDESRERQAELEAAR